MSTTPLASLDPATTVTWLTAAGIAPDRHDEALAEIVHAATTVARDLAQHGTAQTADLAPGNGYAYEVIAVPHTDGNLLVALPEFGRCSIVGRYGPHVPSWVAERFGFTAADPHAHVLALLLSEITHRL